MVLDNKTVVSDLEAKINILRGMLPTELSVLSTPNISKYAFVLYMFYLYRILELAESVHLLQNRTTSSEVLSRALYETNCILAMFVNELEKAIKTKSINKISTFLEKAIFGVKCDEKKLNPIHVMEAIRSNKKTWPECEIIYDCFSEFAHPNGVGIINYVKPFDPHTAETIYFGLNKIKQECPAIEDVIPFIEEILDSYDVRMKLLNDFKNLCIEKEAKKEL